MIKIIAKCSKVYKSSLYKFLSTGSPGRFPIGSLHGTVEQGTKIMAVVVNCSGSGHMLCVLHTSLCACIHRYKYVYMYIFGYCILHIYMYTYICVFIYRYIYINICVGAYSPYLES